MSSLALKFMNLAHFSKSKKLTSFFILLPLCAGYFLSYFMRNMNGPIGKNLTQDLDLNSGSLGLLTGVYFLAFTCCQIPIGIGLDRYGARRIQTLLLLVAATGALLFGTAQNEYFLVLGRLLIGIGTAGCLMAALKTTAQCFPKEKLTEINSCFLMFGGIGALAATKPYTILVNLTSWRDSFVFIACIVVLASIATYKLVPSHSKRRTVEAIKAEKLAAQNSPGLKDIFFSKAFWQIAPVSALTFGAPAAFQGLWAAQWLADVDHVETGYVSNYLLVMACGLIVGAPLIGRFARHYRRHLSTKAMMLIVSSSLVLVELLITVQAPIPSFILWPLVAVFGTIPAISFTAIAENFHEKSIGRANCLLNLCHTATTFTLQTAIGMIVALWPSNHAAYPVTAYQVAFSCVILVQVCAMLYTSATYWRHLFTTRAEKISSAIEA